jgi:hypothetical protein
MTGSEGIDEQEHRKAVCVFAAQELATSRNGGRLQIDGFPDEVERTKPAVDLTAHDGIGGIVAEHTVVEAYDSQLHDNVRVGEAFLDFPDRFGHGLEAPGHYTLAIDTGGGRRFPRRNQEQQLDRLEAWVRRQQLPIPELPQRGANHVRAEPPVVPVPVTLFRYKSLPKDDGALWVVLGRPDDIEDQRAERVARALAAKCPKLEAARTTGSVTLLVLENRDYILTNPWLLMRVVKSLAEPRGDVPDAIICVETSGGDGNWIAYRTKFLDWWSDV